jgi:hypothetical protein
MSSSYVRDLIRTWLAAGPTPFYNTDNEEQNPPDAVWCTVEWGLGAKDKLTLCGNTVERSTFNVVVLGPLGAGDATVIAAAEALIAALVLNVDALRHLQIISTGVPETFSYNKNLFCVSIAVEYEYQP